MKSRQGKNGEAEGGGGCEIEFQEEAGEESVKVAGRTNGRGMVNEERRCARSGGKRKTELRGLHEIGGMETAEKHDQRWKEKTRGPAPLLASSHTSGTNRRAPKCMI